MYMHLYRSIYLYIGFPPRRPSQLNRIKSLGCIDMRTNDIHIESTWIGIQCRSIANNVFLENFS